MSETNYDEPGLTAAEFDQMTQKIKSKQELEERSRPENVYIIFRSGDEQQKALEVIKQALDYRHDLFKKLKTFSKDPTRQNVGVSLEFTDFDPERPNKIKEFFKENNLTSVEDYETAGGQPI